MRSSLRAAVLVTAAAGLVAAASPGARADGPGGVRSRFGMELASRLLRSADPEDKLRGVERAAALGTPESLDLLVRAAESLDPGDFDLRTGPDGVGPLDQRALLVVVRGLAHWTDRERAREALAALLQAQTHALVMRGVPAGSRDPAGDEAEALARVQLARQEAALALAMSGNALAIEALVAAGRSGGPGQEPALQALALVPPVAPLLGGVAMTTPGTIALAAEVGDLRSIDAIQGALRASDGGLRAAALAALGVLGDARVLEAARAAVHDKDARVRIAAADALVRQAAPDAPTAVEGLVMDDATCREGLRLAQLVASEGVTKAAAARAAASAEPSLRAAAIEALGRQPIPLAVGALAALAADPSIAGEVAAALARSPSPAATAALETMASATPGSRRLAARAYFVRRWTHGSRSARLDALLRALGASTDARDRAVGARALAAIDRREHGLPPQEDTRTRELPTLTLLEHAKSGEADGPLAAMEFAASADESLGDAVSALLESRDPVVRAHVARGLARSSTSDAAGRLADAYAFETDVAVRRALVEALAARTTDAGAPLRRASLELAATLDPDRLVRSAARRALDGAPPPARPAHDEVAWLQLAAAPGARVPTGETATLVESDGTARPVAFDDDGYAIVPGVAPGEATVRLAPRLQPYEAP
ncbi:MAG TPA: HEAT repeat domain-containing protein [Polyangiaceae bacterium]